MKKIFNEYLEYLNVGNMPRFLKKYLSLTSLTRLKNVGYFCGMDYASKNIYDFGEYISRYDHSLSVALLTWKYTGDKRATLAGLFHDISTPCFSHVIDYMNKDYKEQESTEEYTKDILNNDLELKQLLKEDNLFIDDLVDFKKYSIVDNKRPKLCTDRLDGIILTSLFWTKGLDIKDVKNIIEDVNVYINEDNEKEIGFKSNEVLEFVLRLNKEIDIICHSKEDNYMMELLAEITKRAINKSIISYDDLYILDENILFNILEHCEDDEILRNLRIFKDIRLEEVPDIILPDIKVRVLKPLINGVR